MPLNKEQKEKIVKLLSEKFKNKNGSVVFTDFHGLSVSQMNELRSKLREAGGTYKVAKKTLINIALKESRMDKADTPVFNGSVGLVFSGDDPLAPIKAAENFSKKEENLKILGGIFENRFVDDVYIKALAALPSKKELIAQIIHCIKGPLSGFLNVVNGNTRGFISIIGKLATK